ncbi:MAG TPA: hypothetical protein P5556_03875 [Candidatus Gastranaerophilales bacterium]|nr:hypothetical protein [Candidatus Gastranaerophilales bacterium]
MKKKVKVVFFALVLTLNNAVFAVTENNFHNNAEKLCLSEELMKELVKETVNVVGKHLLDKYLKTKDAQQIQNNTNAEQQNTVSGASSTVTAQPNASASTNPDADLIILD